MEENTMFRVRSRTRVLIVLLCGLGLAAVSIATPLVAQAQSQPRHTTLYADVQNVQHLMNNEYFLELASEACLNRAVEPTIVAYCFDIHENQVLQLRNTRITLGYMTGVHPWNPQLTPAQQQVITNLLFGTFAKTDTFVIADVNAMLGVYNDSDAVSSFCANRCFNATARHTSASLNYIDAKQANFIEDYLTLHFGSGSVNPTYRHHLP
jgi:hypothetical protein